MALPGPGTDGYLDGFLDGCSLGLRNKACFIDGWLEGIQDRDSGGCARGGAVSPT